MSSNEGLSGPLTPRAVVEAAVRLISLILERHLQIPMRVQG